MEQFDVAIVGGGPGGYVAAIRAAKSGLSVALIEGNELGGTCLNRGCIPSKTLLKHAEALKQIKDSSALAIHVENVSVDLAAMVDRKNNVINQLKNGIKGLLRQNKIKHYQGYGYVADDGKVTIKSEKSNENIQAKHVILATGSQVFIPPIQGADEVTMHTSDTIFDIEEIPERLVIVGGGVIGLEIACIFNSLGTKVDIVEMADRIIPMEDREAGEFLKKELENDGITFHTNAQVTEFKKTETDNKVIFHKDGKETTLATDIILMSVGRRPNVTGIEDLSIQYDGPFVKVNKNMQTSNPNIYAIGDLIGGFQLAHAASNEGLRAVDHILGKENKKNAVIPRCVYTFPEIASVGLTEEQAKEAGHQVKVKKIDLAGNGKAISALENRGFMKIIADKKYNEILGVVMVGAHVTEMISQATAFMHLEGTVDEMESMVFPHPTLAEGLFEAASAYLGKGIHYN
ncbi:dihydrolipoyl dehydrogenase [Pseudogracilibacillus sp. SE30717A]|uniref:dihydrolipoyl dehydrogenase n=1 Tax=Pseudogracilibacillus sp. SE30717A TaxID=3098293 RepID=UPI00300E4C03